MRRAARVDANHRIISFHVAGQPVPKQSYRAARGGGYTDPRVAAWQAAVAWAAKQAMCGEPPLEGPVAVWLEFRRLTQRRVDLDNLSKAVLDGCNGVLWHDDQQVAELHIIKRVVGSDPGVSIMVEPLRAEHSSMAHPTTGDPWRNLCAAVLLQALTDLKRGPLLARDAWEFLRGPDGQWYARKLGIEHAALMRHARERRAG
jgi:Holliday junction resolvase RusA-like endonuclease